MRMEIFMDEFTEKTKEELRQIAIERKLEKHTDQQIYEGCIYLMQEMVNYFREYLEYIGIDIDEIDEDEQFAISIPNAEIVGWLFLAHTRNCGGTSTRELCEKIGIDYGEYVKFEFGKGSEEE